MERLTHKRTNGIKEGYWSPEKKEELVKRLAEYENIGLEPEEIKKLKDGILQIDSKETVILKLSEIASMAVRITPELIRDYEDCEREAAIPGSTGKDCDNCLLNTKKEFGRGLCELAIMEGTLRRFLNQED